MTYELDPRILRVGVEVNGKLHMYEEPAYISVSGVKYANPQQNEATVVIANLSAEVRNFLLTETSPFNRNRTRKRLIVEAGRKSIGTARVYSGDIVSCTPSQPPDIMLTIKSQTCYFFKGAIMALGSLGAQSPLSGVAATVAGSMGLNLMFEANERNIQNWSYTGSALGGVNELQAAGGVNAYVDDDNLVVKNYNQPLKASSHVLSADNGMIGIPEQDEFGCVVKLMYDPRVKLGSQLTVQSKINPAMNGDYTVYKLGFDLNTRAEQFQLTAYCMRKGWSNLVLINA